MSSKVSFYLKEPNANTETLLLCLVYITRSQRFKFSTGLKIHPKLWNGLNAQNPIRKNHPQSTQLNCLLLKYRKDYEDAIMSAKLKGIPITKDFINEKVNKVAQGSQSVFFDYYDEFLKSRRTNCSKVAIQKYQLIKKYLQDFTVKTSYNLTFNSIDLVFYEKFTQYLIYDRGMFNNTVSKTIRFVKTFLIFGADRGYHSNYTFKKFKSLKDNTIEIIALSETELCQIENLEDLSESLELCKDMFLILCYTGLRFSDLKRINGSQITDNAIAYTATKTRESQRIFLNEKINFLLAKYMVDGTIDLPLISNAKTNVHLKEIGQLAELNEPIKKVRMKGGEAVIKELKKWELLTTHTGRRTFTTLSLFKGINPEIVKKITGHKSDAEFKKYQRFNDDQIRKSMEVWDK